MGSRAAMLEWVSQGQVEVVCVSHGCRLPRIPQPSDLKDMVMILRKPACPTLPTLRTRAGAAQDPGEGASSQSPRGTRPAAGSLMAETEDSPLQVALGSLARGTELDGGLQEGPGRSALVTPLRLPVRGSGGQGRSRRGNGVKGPRLCRCPGQARGRGPGTGRGCPRDGGSWPG